MEPEKTTAQATYTAPELLRLLNDVDGIPLTRDRLTIWAQTGVVAPSFWPKKAGRYSVRSYTRSELHRVRLVAHLRYVHGVSMPICRRVLAYLDEHHPQVFTKRSNRTLMIAGKAIYLHSPGQPDVQLPDGQAVLQFNLSDVEAGKRLLNRIQAG